MEAISVNLLDNALKYTPAGGTVRLGVQATGSCCEIRVEDSGPGIPAEDLPHVFERFYRVDKARSRQTGQNGETAGSGAGLGLSIVQSLVEENGGTIEVESVVGQGTTFTVKLSTGDEFLGTP
jgi:signal transduction histidine kinase